MGLFLVNAFSVTSLKKVKEKNWRGLANCLQLSRAGALQRTNESYASDVLRFIHRNGYMIVPPSNPPTLQQIIVPALSTPSRKTRDASASAKPGTSRCPYKIEVVEDVRTIPRFMSKATCHGCDVRCKPVTYTHQVLFNRCRNYWMWTQKTLEVAFVWVMDD